MTDSDSTTPKNDFRYSVWRLCYLTSLFEDGDIVPLALLVHLKSPDAAASSLVQASYDVLPADFLKLVGARLREKLAHPTAFVNAALDEVWPRAEGDIKKVMALLETRFNSSIRIECEQEDQSIKANDKAAAVKMVKLFAESRFADYQRELRSRKPLVEDHHLRDAGRARSARGAKINTVTIQDNARRVRFQG